MIRCDPQTNDAEHFKNIPTCIRYFILLRGTYMVNILCADQIGTHAYTILPSTSTTMTMTMTTVSVIIL